MRHVGGWWWRVDIVVITHTYQWFPGNLLIEVVHIFFLLLGYGYTVQPAHLSEGCEMLL